MLHVKTDEIYGRNDIVNANDFRTHHVTIDSRFRPKDEPASDFSFRLSHPMKNVIQITPTSVEFTQPSYPFSKAHKNTMFRLDVTDYVGTRHYLTITIPDGHYPTLSCLLEEIQRQLDHVRETFGIFMRITSHPRTNQVILRLDGSGPPPSPPGPTNAPSPFGITWVMIGRESRLYDFGLGAHLGFRQHFYVVNEAPFTLQSESPFAAPTQPYYFLQIDDHGLVQQKTQETEFTALARISDPYSPHRSLVGTVTFPRPLDLARVRVRLLDEYGEPADLMNWSCVLQLTEVMNVDLSDNYRNYLWPKEEPRPKRDTAGSAAILAGRNFR